MARRFGVLAGVCVSDQVCASFMCGMWHVDYPFLKERYIKEIKKELFFKKESFFFCQPLSTLRSAFQPINISTTQHCGFGV